MVELNGYPLHFCCRKKLFTGRPSPCTLSAYVSRSYMLELCEEAMANPARGRYNKQMQTDRAKMAKRLMTSNTNLDREECHTESSKEVH
ncbi:Nucleolar 4 [Gossypium arboreum]|uniref:Nucleolar 4 n=1 Tax=Gossypium arboreum TaxID=29729 RepID=A0A0B0MVB6_GOSAR|nr:Nucleolar 4 [Gossypium arboreum]